MRLLQTAGRARRFCATVSAVPGAASARGARAGRPPRDA